MNTEHEPESIDLNELFPMMKPVSSPPSLFTLNGFGLGMYGRREFDRVTGTYIKTRCICALFIPLLPLDAYRVADAEEGGWYFIGKERVSPLAKGWRMLVVLLVAGLVGQLAWSAHKSSPDYQAKQARKEAAELVENGQMMEAAEIYAEMMRKRIGNRDQWLGALRKILRAEIASGDGGRILAAVSFADSNRDLGSGSEPLLPKLEELAVEAAAAIDDDTRKLAILEAFEPAPAARQSVLDARQQLLVKLQKSRPDDVELAVKLALVQEERGEVEAALELLTPVSDQLGDGEGARLLGALLLGNGRAKEALMHLERYVEPRIGKWKIAERAFDRAFEGAQERAIELLEQGKGPKGFESRYERASEAEQIRMVEEFVGQRLQEDPLFLRARDSYEKATAVIPAIMDLGVARLRVAQAESDPAVRGKLLEEAEQGFLSLRSVAGGSEDYKLLLGQVYYWSGREEKGRALFDELLESKGRDAATLFQVAGLMREVGEESEARKLLEEAFPKAADTRVRAGIAQVRSILAADLDEKVEWLKKADPEVGGVRIALAEARGAQAERRGDLEAAEKSYREALAGYDKSGRDSVSLNNESLVRRSLFRVTGDRKEFEAAARLLSEAVALDPDDSVLCFNAADSLLEAAALRVADGKLPPELLQFDVGLGTLPLLYDDEAGKMELLGELREDANLRKAQRHFWATMLLSPKNPAHYYWGLATFGYLRDFESVERLLAQAREQVFDTTEQAKQRKKFLRGEEDQSIRESTERAVERMQGLMDSVEDERGKTMCVSYLAASHMGGFSVGVDPKVDDWLPAVRQAVQDAPSSRSRAVLAMALRAQAVLKLAKEDPECAEVLSSCRRHLGADGILILLVRAKGDLGERVRAHPAVSEARAASWESARRFPGNVTLDNWLLLDGFEGVPEGQLTESVKSNRLEMASMELQRVLSAESAAIGVTNMWRYFLEGKLDDARKIRRLLVADGLKLPELF